MQLTPSQLELVRSHPQQTKLHLSIFRPRPIFKARVDNPSAARGDRTIGYDSVALGSFIDVAAGMTLLAGTTDGGRQLGKVRVRSIDGGQIIVAENSDIKWVDNTYLTVLRFFEVWPIFPRIIPDPADATSVIFYKDWDIPHTNQNAVLGTFVNAGPHRAVFRDCASGQTQVYYSSTGTYNALSGTVYSYEWTFEGGSPSGSTSPDPGNITYNAPGHYVTSLSVSGSNGAVDTTYRYVSVYDYPGCGTGTPPTKWELGSLDGSRSEGGYNVGFRLHEIVEVNEGDVVVLFAEDWYGNTKVSLGGNQPNASSIVFSGYVLDDTIRVNYKNSTVEFQAGSVSSLMKQAEGFSVSVESKASPTTWFELADMDIRRATYHYLKWHTTVLSLTDFQFLGTDRKIQFYDADRGSLYDAIDSLIRSALVGEIVCDRQGKMWAEVSAYAVPNATGTYSPVMELTKRDWVNEPRIEEALSNTTSFIEMGGIAYAGSSTGTFSALLANAPGSAPSYRGKVERTQGLALSDQSQLNQLVGNVFANRNAKYPDLDFELAGNYRNLDIAPQEAVLLNLNPEDTTRGVRISAPYTPVGMRWSFDPKTGLLHPQTSLHIITSGDSGESIIVPEFPPDEGFANLAGGGGFVSPTFPFGFASSFGLADYVIIENHGTSKTNARRGLTIVSNTMTSLTEDAVIQVASPGIYACFVAGSWSTAGAGSYDGYVKIEHHYILSTAHIASGKTWMSTRDFTGNQGAEVPRVNCYASASGLAILAANDRVLFNLTGEILEGSGMSFISSHISMIKLSNI